MSKLDLKGDIFFKEEELNLLNYTYYLNDLL